MYALFLFFFFSFCVSEYRSVQLCLVLWSTISSWFPILIEHKITVSIAHLKSMMFDHPPSLIYLTTRNSCCSGFSPSQDSYGVSDRSRVKPIWGTWSDLRGRCPLLKAQNDTKTRPKILKFRISGKTYELERFPARYCHRLKTAL